jgi:hypothetical protein
MNTTWTIRSRLGVTTVAAVGLLCLSAAPGARAETMLVSQTSLVSGSYSSVDSFSVPSSGTVTVELSNLPWPQALSSLSFMASSASEVLSSWSTQTSSIESFAVTPGTYFAHVFGSATGPLDLGLYSMTVSFTPAGTVALPATGWMLGMGLLMLLGFARVLGSLDPAAGMSLTAAIR